MAKAPDMYNHVDPGVIGNLGRTVVSELAGRSNIVLKAMEFGLEVDNEQAAKVLETVKAREAAGWTYEAADASFELLLRRVLGLLAPEDEPFQTQHYRVSVGGGEGSGGNGDLAEAILSVVVQGQRKLGAGEGNGPVDALDHAFRNAVNGTWPELDLIHLSDFKVRILEASQGTDAVTRVLVTATDGHDAWDTVGVNPNIVEASWRALSDAYTYAILRGSWR
jgi:2-isopropylmalate synthase